MARIGVRDLFIQELTTDTETTTAYGDAERLAKAITISVTPQTSEGSLYADDALAEYYSGLSNYELSFEIDDLPPEKKAKLLGYDVASNGQVLVTQEAVAPYFGVSFRAERSDGSYEYRQLFKVRFAPTEDSYATKGESIEFQTNTVTGMSMPLEKNGAFETYVIGTSSNKSLTDKWNEEMFTELSSTTTRAASN